MQLILCGPSQLVESNEAGTVVPLAAKTVALLAYLALEPGAHAREKLCGLLWGDVSEARAHGSLRQAIRHLRMAIGESLIVGRTSLALVGDFPSDVRDFLTAVPRDPERAILVDIPRLFEALHSPGAELFEEWAERTRQSLMHRYRGVLSSAARSAFARQEWPRTLELATRWLAVDPVADEAEHLLLEVLYVMGQRDTALASYRHYRVVRERETGHQPSLALRELAERIEEAPHAPAPERIRAMHTEETQSPAPIPTFQASLISREEAWSALERAKAECRDGRSHIVVIEGETGVGKSRLLDDFLRYAASEQATVLRGRAYQSSVSVSYGPMLEMLRAAINAPGAMGTDSIWLAEISRVVPEVRQAFPGIPEPGVSTANGGSLLHEGIAQLLLAAADENVVVIALDDLEWFDADSCALLHFLVRRLESAPVLWCMTFTLGVLERDAPAARLTRALRGMSSHTRVPLHPLSCEDIRRLICELGRVKNPHGAKRLSARVHEVTGGNPLYAVELLKTLFARGWLVVHPETQEWTTTATGADELQANDLFPHVRDAIAERIDALPDEQHALLLTIAVTGNGCHVSLLSYVHGISRLRAAHICDILAARHLVVEAGAMYRCAHNIIASVVLESMSPSRRREVHRMIALALTEAAASIRQYADPGDVARHAELGGETAMSHRFALAASERCVERSAWEDALNWLDMASANARADEEVQTADKATAALFERAGWLGHKQRSRSPVLAPALLERRDVDIGVSHTALS